MKDKLSLKEIRKNWWWKRREIRRDGLGGVDWPLVEESARNYELMRRSKNGGRFTQTYLELCRAGKTIVHTLWVNYGQGLTDLLPILASLMKLGGRQFTKTNIGSGICGWPIFSCKGNS
jgi:hypothetical protein